ncbi:MAG: phosphatase PAP2 family protein [Sphingomonas sp.]
MLSPLPRLLALARSIRGDGRLLLAFLALAILSLVFLKLASEVMEGETMALDRWILSALRHPDNPENAIGPGWLGFAMRDITALGGATGLALITLLVIGLLLCMRKFATAGFVTAAIAGGAVLSSFLKSLFMRPRPDVVPYLVDFSASSFPSGHAMNSAIAFLTLGALLTRTQEDRGVRIYLIAVSILLTLLVGFSRVYLGVHWPSDVIAGWIVGAAWATFCLAIARILQEHRQIEQPDEKSG